MKKYINCKLYGEPTSFLVTDIDEEKGTALAVEIPHPILPDNAEEGFEGNCPDKKAYLLKDPTPPNGAKPFKIHRNKEGIWGWWSKISLLMFPLESITDIDDVLQKNPSVRIEDFEPHGKYVVWYALTKTGKQRKTFRKVGRLADFCCFYYGDEFYEKF